MVESGDAGSFSRQAGTELRLAAQGKHCQHLFPLRLSRPLIANITSFSDRPRSKSDSTDALRQCHALLTTDVVAKTPCVASSIRLSTSFHRSDTGDASTRGEKRTKERPGMSESSLIDARDVLMFSSRLLEKTRKRRSRADQLEFRARSRRMATRANVCDKMPVCHHR